MVSAAQGSPGQGRRGQRLRRLRRILVRGTAAVVVVVLLLAASLLLPGVRGRLLALGLDRAGEALPGRLEVGRAAWPSAGRIVLEDILWRADDADGSAEADTLARVRRLALAVDLRSLRARDLALDSLALEVAWCDLPALVALWSPTAAAPADTDTAPAVWTGPYLRAGGRPGLPSLLVRSLDVQAERMRLSAELGLAEAHLQAAGELRGGYAPALTIAAAAGRLRRDGPDPASLDLRALSLGLADDGDGWIAVDSLSLSIAAAGSAEQVARWQGQGPLHLRADGRLRPAGGAIAADLALGLDSPLAPWWPTVPMKPGRPDSLGRLAAELRVQGRVAGDSVSVRLTADLAGTADWSRAYLAGAADFLLSAPWSGTAVIDSLDLALPGLDLRGAADLSRDRLALRLGGHLRTPCPTAERFVPAVADTRLETAFAVQTAGSWDEPSLDLTLDGSAVSPALEVGRATLNLRGGRRDLTLRLNAGGGLVRHGITLADSLRLRVRLRPALGEDLRLPDRMQAEVAADALAGPRFEHAHLRARLDFAPTAPLAASVELDTLDVGYTGLTVQAGGRLDAGMVELLAAVHLTAPCPLLESLVPALAGGTIAAEATLALQGPRDDPRVDLRVVGSARTDVAAVPQLVLAVTGDRQALHADLQAGGGIELGGRALADSLRLNAALVAADSDSLPLQVGATAWQGSRRLGLAAAAAVDSLIVVRLDTLELQVAGERVRLAEPATVRLDTARQALDVSRLLLRGDPGTLDLRLHLEPSAAAIHGSTDLLLTEAMLQVFAPNPFWSRDGGLDLGITGEVDLDIGRTGAGFSGGVDLRLMPHRQDPQLAAALRFGLAAGDSGGLGADFSVSAADTVLVAGSLLWPGRVDLARGQWVPDPQRLLEVSVPEQELVTQVMRRLVPQGLAVRGAIRVGANAGLAVAGGPPSPDAPPPFLTGVVAAERLQIETPNGSRVEVVLDCRLAGTPADPRLEGTVRVPSGFVRIPELPRNLLPQEGEARLWTAAASDSLALFAGPAPAWGPDEAGRSGTPFFPDLALAVELPGNLRIHGYGLDVEVSGEIDVSRGRDPKGRPGPALVGQARSVEGSLRFMNRMFRIERAEALFTGEVPANPTLDMLLQTEISGTTIRLAVTGRASAPVVDLTSNPDMNQTDIMAYLLFGRPIGDLDNEQRGRMDEEPDASQQLRENLTGLALAFGTADLQSSVSSTLGVDIVELGSDQSGGSTLTAGKYISPKVLLKYNASLEKAGSYYVTLEYAISQVFKLVSTYGQGEEASGIEVKWIRRY